ncbi:MAG: hypothetical protein J4F41_00045 [Alphaproteobacteria bacterium]|nr:hypothetical protein [Alphaproteobacteria bacterium]
METWAKLIEAFVTIALFIAVLMTFAMFHPDVNRTMLPIIINGHFPLNSTITFKSILFGILFMWLEFIVIFGPVVLLLRIIYILEERFASKKSEKKTPSIK